MKQPYLTQQKAINETLEHLNEGKTKVINVQFCGMGKTELGAWISSEIKGNVLFIVHKNTILKQAYTTYKELIKGRSFGYFTCDIKQNNKNITFASVQTLCKEKNLAKFSQDYFECIIIDECHHMATPSYNKILDYFDSKYLLGFTATPYRLDKKPILDLFDEKVGFFDEEGNDDSLRKGIEMGYLSPLRYFGLNDNIDYSKIYHNGYKYKKNDLDKALIIKERNDIIAKKWLEMADGKKTIAFCNGIKHINSILKTFKENGINAVGLSYKTSKRMQKIIEKQFREGVYDVILTVDLYIEGVDFPDCECVMFLRPTESERIFVQQLGRVMRIFRGKQYGMVMDFVGNQKNAYERQKWIKKRLLGKNNLIIPKERKPIYYYDPLIQIRISEEIVDIFRLKKEITKESFLLEYKEIKNILGKKLSFADMEKNNINPYLIYKFWSSLINFRKEIGETPFDRRGEKYSKKELKEDYLNVKKIVGKPPSLKDIRKHGKIGIHHHYKYGGISGIRMLRKHYESEKDLSKMQIRNALIEYLKHNKRFLMGNFLKDSKIHHYYFKNFYKDIEDFSNKNKDLFNKYCSDKNKIGSKYRKGICIEIYGKVKNKLKRVPTLKEIKEHGCISGRPFERFYGSYKDFLKYIGDYSSYKDLYRKVKNKGLYRKVKTYKDLYRKVKNKGLYRKVKTYKDFLKYIGDYKLSQPYKKSRRFSWTKEDLINHYFRLKKEIKKQPSCRDIDKDGVFNHTQYTRFFGSYPDFLKNIGEPLLNNKNYKKLDKEDIINNYYEIRDKIRREPTDRDLLTSKGSRYSSHIYRKIWGSLTKFRFFLNERE